MQLSGVPVATHWPELLQLNGSSDPFGVQSTPHALPAHSGAGGAQPKP